MPVLAPEKVEEGVEEEPVREEGRSVTGFCERVREGKASVFCRLLEAEASLNVTIGRKMIWRVASGWMVPNMPSTAMMAPLAPKL